MEGYIITVLVTIAAAGVLAGLSKITTDSRLKHVFLWMATLFIFFAVVKSSVIEPENITYSCLGNSSTVYTNCTYEGTFTTELNQVELAEIFALFFTLLIIAFLLMWSALDFTRKFITAVSTKIH